MQSMIIKWGIIILFVTEILASILPISYGFAFYLAVPLVVLIKFRIITIANLKLYWEFCYHYANRIVDWLRSLM